MVVLFHLGVAPFHGGFVGVDVFFVISGLLMTQIIARRIERGNLSVLGFYGDRVRRIVPALAVLCAVLFVAGAVLLDPLTMSELAQDALASLLFYSNMLYATQSGYFAEAADTNWLLHTWTLSVEWQFYLLYPVIMLLMARWRWLWRNRAAVLGLACVACFAATMTVSARSLSFQQYAFFLLPTRAWEMLAGGWVALAAPRMTRVPALMLMALGLAAIVVSATLFDPLLPWPSLWTALPVLGTVMVLTADRQGSIWANIPGVQALGQWSYSLYLWHWPLVVAISYFSIERTPLTTAAMLALAVLLSFLSYEFAENWLRDRLIGRSSTSRARWLGLAAGFMALCVVCAGGWQSVGFGALKTASMTPATRARLADYRAALTDWRGMSPCGGTQTIGTGRICILGKGNPVRVAVIGDSHAEQMLPRLVDLARRGQLEITLVRQQGCPPLPGLTMTETGTQCPRAAAKIFDYVAKGKFRRVVVLAAWEIYFDRPAGVDPARLCRVTWRGCRPLQSAAVADAALGAAMAGFTNRLAALRRGGAEVVVILPFPIPDHVSPRDYYRQSFVAAQPVEAPPIDRAAFVARTAGIRERLSKAAVAAGATLVDPVASVCDTTRCAVFDNGEYVFRDTHHLRASVVKLGRFSYLDRALGG